MQYKFSKIDSVVTKVAQHSETKVSGGGGTIKGDLHRIRGTIAGIQSETSYLTDFWVKFGNGSERNYRFYNMIPIKEGSRLRFYLAGKTNKTIAIKNIDTGQFYNLSRMRLLALDEYEGSELYHLTVQKKRLQLLSRMIISIGAIILAPFLIYYLIQLGFTLTYPTTIMSDGIVKGIIGIAILLFGFSRLKNENPKNLASFSVFYLAATLTCCIWVFSLPPVSWLISPILFLVLITYASKKTKANVKSIIGHKEYVIGTEYIAAWENYLIQHG